MKPKPDRRMAWLGWDTPRVVPLLLLVAAGVAIAWLNYHASDDVQPVAAALVLAAFGFAVWQPRSSWLVVPLLWLAVPASSVLGYATNFHPGVARPAPLYQTVVALIPTALGALAGAGTRWALRAA